MKKLAAAAVSLLAATTMTGCEYSFNFTTAKVKAEEVQNKVAAEIKAQTGREATVRCPEDLPGKQGSTMACTATVNAKDYPVHITVTEVKGSDIKYMWRLEAGNDASPSPTRPSTSRTPYTRPSSSRPASDRPSTAPSNDSSGSAVRVTKENLEAEVASVVKRETGKDATVKCPRDLDAKPGTSTFCTVDLDGRKRSAKIEITRVDGKNVYFTTKMT